MLMRHVLKLPDLAKIFSCDAIILAEKCRCKNLPSTYNLLYVRHSTYDLMNTNIRRRDGSKERVYLQNLHFFSGRITVLYQSKQRPQFANVVIVRTKNIFQLNAATRVNEFCNDFPQ